MLRLWISIYGTWPGKFDGNSGPLLGNPGSRRLMGRLAGGFLLRQLAESLHDFLRNLVGSEAVGLSLNVLGFDGRPLR